MTKRSAILIVGLGLATACGPKGEGEATAGITDSATATDGSTTGNTTSPSTSSTTATTNDTSDATSSTTTGGSTSSGTGGSTSGASDSGPKFDLGQMPDVGTEECIECALTIASKQSGVFDITGANIFATATLMNEIVYALGDYGSGRFIATADSSLPFNEVTDCPLHEWLAGTAAPNPPVLSFGWTASDGPKNWTVANETAAGVHLPAQYIGNPAQLAADFDIVLYLEASGQFDQGDEPTNAEMQTLLDYVQLHGGGLYVSSEFADPNGNAYLQPADLVSVNRLLVPLGAEALQVSLNWGNVDGNIDFACFPAPEG